MEETIFSAPTERCSASHNATGRQTQGSGSAHIDASWSRNALEMAQVAERLHGSTLLRLPVCPLADPMHLDRCGQTPQ
jgi:hypothetical protein